MSVDIKRTICACEKGLQAMKENRELAQYLIKHFQNELKGESTAKMAIRLLDKIRQKPEVTEEFVKKWVDILSDSAIACTDGEIDIDGDYLIKMLKEARVKIKGGINE